MVEAEVDGESLLEWEILGFCILLLIAGNETHLYTPPLYLYPEFLQTETVVRPLKEESAAPAQSQDGYGWERMLTEPLCLHYHEDYGMAVHILRFHNICGLQGTW